LAVATQGRATAGAAKVILTLNHVAAMALIEALYLQDPFWIWLAVASLFVALNLASGSSFLMWPGVAAAIIATLEIAGLRLGLRAEAGLFVALTVVMLAVALRRPRTEVTVAATPTRARVSKSTLDPGRQEQTARLVGRIARSTCEFANGVGRVWIDGAEWGAELDGAGETLPEGESVRVTRVVGGIKLQVRPLDVD